MQQSSHATPGKGTIVSDSPAQLQQQQVNASVERTTAQTPPPTAQVQESPRRLVSEVPPNDRIKIMYGLSYLLLFLKCTVTGGCGMHS